VSLAFWILKIAATPLREIYRDVFAQTVKVGYLGPVPAGERRATAESRTW
jgi:uncharacterized membrane-anchored protein